MKTTFVAGARAVRMFMATQSAHPDQQESAATSEQDIKTAHRLTAALRKARDHQRNASLVKSSCNIADAKVYGASASQSASVLEKTTAVDIALSYGKSAFLIHCAHDHGTRMPTEVADQGRCTGATSGGQLLEHVEKAWDCLSSKQQTRWTLSTPQGSRLLRMVLRDAWVDPHHAMTTNGKDSFEHVRRLVPRAAAVVGQPPQQQRALTKGPTTAAATPAVVFTDAVNDVEAQRGIETTVHVAYGNTASHRVLRTAVNEAVLKQHRSKWRRVLRSILGGEGATVFIDAMKELQEPVEEIDEAQSVPPAPHTAVDPAPTEELLNFCADLGIFSPRRSFVLQRLLPHLEDQTGQLAPLTLAEVRTLAESFSDEYNKNIAQLQPSLSTPSSDTNDTANPVADYQEALVEEDVHQVRQSIERFQDELFTLKRCIMHLRMRRQAS